MHGCLPSQVSSSARESLQSSSPDGLTATSKVILRQGCYIGSVKDDVEVFHGVPYAQPFSKRFQLPQAPNDSIEEFSAIRLGANCPQLPSRLAFINGNWDKSTRYDEKTCGVLSVYVPKGVRSVGTFPVIVWVHGGAFCTGGSQLSNYDGTKLAEDAKAIVVCINYRFGVLGFLYDETRSLDPGLELPAGAADVVAAFKWVHANIGEFGGDHSNITAMGQSAGAYLLQVLVTSEPELFHKGILISSPAAITNPPSTSAKVRQDLASNLPEHLTPESATMDVLLQAQAKATACNSSLIAPWCPTTSTSASCRKENGTSTEKNLLLGWTATDGMAFLAMRTAGNIVSQSDDHLTDEYFRVPSRALARQWLADGHKVTTFQLNWAPESYPLGPTHCVDLPLTFGFDAWTESPMCKAEDRAEWDSRGLRWRQIVGNFAHTGTLPTTGDGIEVFEHLEA